MRISDWSSDVCSSDLTPAAIASALSVVRRIGGRNSHPDFHRVQSGCGPLSCAHHLRNNLLQIASDYRISSMPSQLRDLICSGKADGLRLSTGVAGRSEEHTSELQSLMRISYAVFCLKNKKIT